MHKMLPKKEENSCMLMVSWSRNGAGMFVELGFFDENEDDWCITCKGRLWRCRRPVVRSQDGVDRVFSTPDPQSRNLTWGCVIASVALYFVSSNHRCPSGHSMSSHASPLRPADTAGQTGGKRWRSLQCLALSLFSGPWGAWRPLSHWGSSHEWAGETH